MSSPTPSSSESPLDTIQVGVKHEDDAYEPIDADKRELGQSTANSLESAESGSPVLHGYKLVTLIASLMLTFFCVAVDNTSEYPTASMIPEKATDLSFLTTAIPSITDSFHTYRNVGWYGSAYLLTTSSCQILYSRFYAYFPVRWVLVSAIFVFEVGSLICATAPNSITFICGRAIAGLGSAGIFTGSFAAATHTTPVHLQPLVVGLLGGVFGLSSIFGPLDLETLNGGLWSNILRFDPLGNILLFASILCLLLALQWGGVEYSWSDGRVIALLTVFGILVILMVLVEVYNQKNAMMPARVAAQRTVASASLFAFCIGGSIFPVVYFLPIWFQGVRGYGAIESALHTLPLILSQLLATVSSGALTKVVGYCVPFVYISALLVPIGTGLITTWTVDTSTVKWIGYQIVLGLGFGSGFQQGNVAAASGVQGKDVPTATALAFSYLFLGGAVFLNVAQNVFSKRLASNLIEAASALNITNLNLSQIGHVGATQIKDLVPPQYLPEFLTAYNDAVTHTFLISVIVSCVGCIGAAGMEWINLEQWLAKDAAAKRHAATSSDC
ncbi:hypothetical protein PRZ48_009166 [Zasmidium cellare]|uniref:Major facilitator superfamily (MFS) profile domain-containing protein n=1 Tax=Zasmidium cellare TaxID=395010 RepID=A0ABR0EBL2_ZASCE|nr:hypothetical protein PRZ48_009166 [Zasmidium cellare]